MKNALISIRLNILQWQDQKTGQCCNLASCLPYVIKTARIMALLNALEREIDSLSMVEAECGTTLGKH